MQAIAAKSAVAAAALVAASHGLFAADFHEGLAAHRRGDYATALHEWRPLAEHGDAEAQYRLARMYFHGEGVRDDAEAARWYHLAAEQGHVKSQNNLGLAYELGRGVAQDDAEAMQWYRRAAEQDLATAQSNLGRMYDHGRGVERDPAEAAKWYRRAADQGETAAQYRLGVLYEEGSGVSRDLGRAAKWYRRAAQQGHAPAQAAVGSMYATGRGVERNAAKAAKWLGRASAQGVTVDLSGLAVPIVNPGPEAEAAADPVQARAPPAVSLEPSELLAPHDPVPPPSDTVAVESEPRTRSVRRGRVAASIDYPELLTIGRRAEGGDAQAQYRLAQMYSTGDGAPQSLDDGARWYRAAAEQGHGMAAYKLAFLHLRGRGVPRKDFVQAYRWFSVSAALGVGDAGNWRERIAKKMSAEEIAAAQRFLGAPGKGSLDHE